MNSAPHKVAVLGLGRMGGAIAARLADHGFKVTGWTRSGRPARGVTSVGDPAQAVAGAEIVLMALFDGTACRCVLDEIRAELRSGAILVNTSTIGPDEAATLAGRVGPAYVHAALLGSVPAAEAGTLQILAAADHGTLGRVRPVLEVLGTVRPVENASTAAALKLVANHSLAGGVLALRDSLRQGDALGLPREQVLDVLELGTLGGLVVRKRHFLGSRAATTAPAEFTLRALAKDMDLLGAASTTPLRSAGGGALADVRALAGVRALADAPAVGDADFVVAATVPAAQDAALAPLRAYVRGHATGDPAHFRAAFLPSARVEGIRDGAFVSWGLEEYCALFPGRPAPDEATRSRRMDTLDVHGTVATATMTLAHGPDTFTDVFLLMCVEGEWRIANKAYHHDRYGRT
ncbi:nuclear transport factor 2 family protein [Streptomyces sp. NPDC090022]|uniref:nuclear transport factor 2 family protein n=1 Tax=Streptomyces sp. NPDC090022 TaxID=3365920 RepID=UPI0038049F86